MLGYGVTIGALCLLLVLRGYLVIAGGLYAKCTIANVSADNCGLDPHQDMLVVSSAWARAPEVQTNNPTSAFTPLMPGQ